MGVASATNDDNVHKTRFKVAISQVIPVMVKNILMLGFGMSLGYPTTLIPSLSEDKDGVEFLLNEEQLSWIGSLMFVSLPIGCLVSGAVSQSVGRKMSMQLGSGLTIVGLLVFWFCNDIWQIYTALIILGLAGGLQESPVLTYVGEITEPRFRGIFVATGALSISLGVLIEFLLGSVLHWRTVSICNVIPSLVALILLFFVPESPHWLVMKNKMERAKKSLAWVRGWANIQEIEQEYQEIVKNNGKKFNYSKKGIYKLEKFLKPQFVHPYAFMCYLFFFHNFSGMSTLTIYAVKTFEVFEVPIDDYHATILLGVSQFLGCLTCVCMISRTGKRILLLISIGVAVTSITIVASYAHLTNTNYLYNINEVSKSNLLDYKWIPLLFILIAAYALSCGIRTLPWMLLAEVFPMETRSVATGTLGAYNYILSFISSKTFLALVAGTTLPGVLWFYASVCLISVVILYFWLPETEGKTLQNITDHFAGVSKLGNKIGPKLNPVIP